MSTVLTACTSTSTPENSAEQPRSKTVPAIRELLPVSVKKSNTLQFGALWETPPVIYVDEKDPTRPIGITPQLAAQLGGVLGVDIKWQNLQWPAQLPGLQSRNVDVLFGQVSITPERERSVIDLIPFQKRGFGLLVAAGNPHKIAQVAGLCGLRVGVPIGSNTSQLMKDISRQKCVGAGRQAIKLNEYNGATAAVQALRAASIDAWFDSAPSIAGIAATDKKAFTWVAVPENEIQPEYTALAVAKDNPKLTAALVAALKQIIANGSYAKIYQAVPGGDKLMLTEAMIVPNPLTRTPVGQKAGNAS